MKTKNMNTKNISVKASVLGILCAVLTTTIMAMAISTLMYNERIHENQLGLLIFLIQLISAFVGCICSSLIGKGNRIVQSFITAGSYYLVLIAATILFLDGKFQGTLRGLAAVALGSVIPLVTRLFFQKRGNTMKMPRFSR